MSPEKMTSKLNHKQDTLNAALLLTEVGVDLRGCYVSGTKCVSQLKNIVNGTEKAVSALQMSAKCALEQAHKIVSSISTDSPTKECKELLGIIEKQLVELESSAGGNKDIAEVHHHQKHDRVRSIETKQKSCDNLAYVAGNKNSKCEINEKYPGSISRESLIDLNAVVNLPPVPEDIFTSFSATTKPTRSSSLSSLKSMRKVKMFLQKAESSDDEDSSDVDDHDFPMGDGKGRDDSDEGKLPSPMSKKLLGNITEETKIDE